MEDRTPIALATRNPHKAEEIRGLLAGALTGELRTLDGLGIAPTEEEESIEAFHTFRENAIAKARYFAAQTGLPTLADDSGLAVDALGGAPGVRSKRFAADAGRVVKPSDLDRANNRLLLDRLREVPPDGRTARYVCAVALAGADRPPRTAVGTCPGVIADAPSGSGGFGYDPLFYLPDLDATFGELGEGAKRRRSHRSRAIRALAGRVRHHASSG